LQAILDRYSASGIENILALGVILPDPCRIMIALATPFQYADGLVSFIKQWSEANQKPGFGIGVAGFPRASRHAEPSQRNGLLQTERRQRRRLYLHAALLFQSRFLRLRERCEFAGIHIPIIAGIMPVTRDTSLTRMAELALGARFPARLLKAIDRCGSDPDAIDRVGIHWATEQCRDLLDNHVRGLHFYTLNRSDATRRIYENLGVKNSQALSDLMRPAAST